MRGKIARKLGDKGFGFIEGEEDGKDYFFHISNCPDGDFESMKVGDVVDFTPTRSPKGPRAEDVRKE